MKLLTFVLFCFISISSFAQPVEKSEIFNEATIKMLDQQIDSALMIHPALLYNIYLIKQSVGNLERNRKLMRLYWIDKEIFLSNKGSFRDSLINELRKASMSGLEIDNAEDLLNDFDEDIVDEIFYKEEESNLLKSQLKYSINQRKYYEYCRFINNFKNEYDSSKNYKALLDIEVKKFSDVFNKDILNYSKISLNEKEKFIANALTKWYVLNEYKNYFHFNFAELVRGLYSGNYDVAFNIHGGISYAPYSHKSEFKGSTYYIRNADYNLNINYKSSISLNGGFRIKLKQKKSIFSWIDFNYSYRIGSFNFSENLLPDSEFVSFRKYTEGSYTDYLLYKPNGKVGNDYMHVASMNFPVYYLFPNLCISIGAEASLLTYKSLANIKIEHYTNFKSTSNFEILTVRNIENYNIKEEKKISVMPIIKLDYEVNDYLLISGGSNITGFMLGVSGNLNF